MRRTEPFPEACREWSGAESYARSLVAAHAMERHASGGTAAADGGIAATVGHLLTLAVYCGALDGQSRREALRAAGDTDGSATRSLNHAARLQSEGRLAAPEARRALADVLAFVSRSDKTLGTVASTAVVIVMATSDAGYRIETEPILVRTTGSDGATGSRMVSIADVVAFDRSGWTVKEQTGGNVVWTTPSGETVHLWHVKPGTAVVPMSATSILEVRHAERAGLASTSALVELDVIAAAGTGAISAVIRTPTRDRGLAYSAELTVPFEDIAICLRVSASEGDVTGRREAMVLAEGASLAAYGPGSADDEGLDATAAESRRWDPRCPDHPLTRVRRRMAHVVDSLTLAEYVFGNETPVPLPAR